MQRLSLVFLLVGVGCDPPPASPPDASTGSDKAANADANADGGADATPDGAAAPPPDRASKPPVTDPAPSVDASQKYEVVAGTDPCTSDADCVKAECCHPKTCVAAGKAPSCGDVACTLDCQGGTMDCYGGCLCQDGKCAARRWLGPADG